MHIVGGIKLPKSADASDLYIQCNEAASINYQGNDKKVVLRQGGIISSNSYFNSFFEKFYTKYTTGVKLLTRWFKAAAKSSIEWPSVSREWKSASNEMKSTIFWQQYLGLKN